MLLVDLEASICLPDIDGEVRPDLSKRHQQSEDCWRHEEDK